ncbi:MAG: hypothetical protein JWP13_93 [Candidatus Saccharibacteria bacterium]|nr:hypothetical protein [Candidatus Saccharibacteria bacterium]
MKNLQHGFTVIESCLIIITLTLIGFAGWYVFDKQKTAISPEVAAENQRLNAEAAKYQAFSSEDGYQFAHLKTWTAVAAKDSSGRNITRVTSPDYIASGVNENEKSTHHKGAYIELSASKDKGFRSIQEYLQAGQDGTGEIKDSKKITVDGQAGVTYRLESAGLAKQVVFTRAKGTAYEIVYVDPNTSDFEKYQADFDELVKTFNIVSPDYPEL